MAEQRRVSDTTILEQGEHDAEAHEVREAKSDRDKPPREIKEVRATDIEPYTGLRYLSKLFRFMAVILVLLLVAEVVTGIYTQGSASVPTLLGEASRLIVLAGVLWGTGDLAHLLIDVGHDVRAARILVARVAHKANVAPLSLAHPASDRTVVERSRVERPTDDVAIDRSTLPRRNGVDRSDDSGEGPPIP